MNMESLNQTENENDHLPRLLDSPRKRTLALIIMAVFVVTLWGITRLVGGSSEAPPSNVGPANNSTQQLAPLKPALDATKYDSAAKEFLVAYNTWESNMNPETFAQKLQPLINTNSDMRTSLTSRTELTNPTPECATTKCSYTPSVALLSQEYQQNDVWTGQFKVTITQNVNGNRREVESFIWVVRATPPNPKPDMAINTYSTDMIED